MHFMAVPARPMKRSIHSKFPHGFTGGMGVGLLLLLTLTTTSFSEPPVVSRLKAIIGKTREKIHRPFEKVAEFTRNFEREDPLARRYAQDRAKWNDDDARGYEFASDPEYPNYPDRDYRVPVEPAARYVAPPSSGAFRQSATTSHAKPNSGRTYYYQPPSEYGGTGALPRYLQPPPSVSDAGQPAPDLTTQADRNLSPSEIRNLPPAESGKIEKKSEVIQPPPPQQLERIVETPKRPEVSANAPLDAKSSSNAPISPLETKKQSEASKLPYGIPIPGKVGFVYSPFASEKGMVDVTDVPTGTKVECPYTGKTFRVP